MEKHQYGFAVMNTSTGGIRKKSFWGTGESEPECKKNATEQAWAYANTQAEQAYSKACAKCRGYRPSRDSYRFSLVGCSLWK